MSSKVDDEHEPSNAEIIPLDIERVRRGRAAPEADPRSRAIRDTLVGAGKLALSRRSNDRLRARAVLALFHPRLSHAVLVEVCERLERAAEKRPRRPHRLGDMKWKVDVCRAAFLASCLPPDLQAASFRDHLFRHDVDPAAFSEPQIMTLCRAFEKPGAVQWKLAWPIFCAAGAKGVEGHDSVRKAWAKELEELKSRAQASAKAKRHLKSRT